MTCTNKNILYVCVLIKIKQQPNQIHEKEQKYNNLRIKEKEFKM